MRAKSRPPLIAAEIATRGRLSAIGIDGHYRPSVGATRAILDCFCLQVYTRRDLGDVVKSRQAHRVSRSASVSWQSSVAPAAM